MQVALSRAVVASGSSATETSCDSTGHVAFPLGAKQSLRPKLASKGGVKVSGHLWNPPQLKLLVAGHITDSSHLDFG